MRLLDIQKRYLEEKGDKYAYFSAMFDVHRRLFEYPELLAGSPVRKIDMTQEGVLFEIEYEGVPIKICADPQDAHSLPLTFLNFKNYDEARESRFIFQMIQPGDTVFDIGANIGWYSLNILLRKKPVTVYSFEPIPASYQLLVKNFRLNGQSAELAFNVGLSNENKVVKFFFDTKCAMASSMANLRNHEETVEVVCQARRLDDMMTSFSGLKRLDFIKCDVEGAELLVYQGALKTLETWKPIVFSEILRKWSKKFNYHPNDILDLFRKLKYECYVIEGESLATFGRVDDFTIPTNYFFLHNEKHEKLIKELVRD